MDVVQGVAGYVYPDWVCVGVLCGEQFCETEIVGASGWIGCPWDEHDGGFVCFAVCERFWDVDCGAEVGFKDCVWGVVDVDFRVDGWMRELMVFVGD